MDHQLDADDEDGLGFGDGKQDSENATMHGDVRSLMFMNWNTERLWGAPGMTQLLMSEDLLNIHIREWSTTFPDGFPLTSYIQAVGQEEDMATKNQWQQWALHRENTKYDSGGKGGYRYAWVHSTLLLASAVRSNPSLSSIHDGFGGRMRCATLGQAHIGAAVMVRLETFYNDPLVFETTGGNTSMASVASFMLTAFEHMGAGQHPGLGRLTASAIREVAGGSLSSIYSIKLLKRIQQEQKKYDRMHGVGSFWNRLDEQDDQDVNDEVISEPRQRACIAYELVCALSSKTPKDLVVNKEQERDNDDSMPVMLFAQLLEDICSADPSTRLRLWAQGSVLHFSAPGVEDEYRAFFHYMLGREENTPAVHQPQELNMSALVWSWKHTVLPRSWVEGEHTDAMKEASRHKMVCLEAVMEETYFHHYFQQAWGEESGETCSARLVQERAARIANLLTPDQTFDLFRFQHTRSGGDIYPCGKDYSGNVYSWYHMDRCRQIGSLHAYQNTVQDMNVEELMQCIRRQTRWLMAGEHAPALPIPPGTFDGAVLDGRSQEELVATLLKILGDTKWNVDDAPQCRKSQKIKQQEEQEHQEHEKKMKARQEKQTKTLQEELPPTTRAEFDALRASMGEMVAINHRSSSQHHGDNAGMEIIHQDAMDGNLGSMVDELNAGTHVDVRDSMTETPLMLAACHQKVECVKVLLARGADVWLVDYRGKSAMGYGGPGSSWFKEGTANSQEVVRLLEEALRVQQPEPDVVRPEKPEGCCIF